MRFKTELDAAGQRTETIREADTMREAAELALKGWHSSARITSELGRGGKDARGFYLEFTARIGSSWGSVKVRAPH